MEEMKNNQMSEVSGKANKADKLLSGILESVKENRKIPKIVKRNETRKN